MRTVAGGGPDRLPARESNLNRLSGVCQDPQGVLYIVVRDAHRVYRMEDDGSLRVVAGMGAAGFSGDDGPASLASLNQPEGCAVSSDGTVYIADRRNNRVRRVDAGGVITTIAGTGADSSTGSGGPAAAATLAQPSDLALDGAGNLLVSEFSTGVVRRIGVDGVINLVAGTGRAGFGGDGGPAAQAQMSGVTGVAVDSQGRVWIADGNNHRIRRVDANGIITTVAGGANSGFAGDGGPADAARLNSPSDVALDSAGNAYIADASNRRIRRVAANGTISTIAGNGNSGFENDNTPALTTPLNPASLVVDGAGTRVVFSDVVNSRVRRLSLADSRVTTVAGNGQLSFSGEGVAALQASLGGPTGVWASETELLIGDTNNHRVRRVDLATGLITTIAGTGSQGSQGDNGPAVRAQLSQPWGLTRDGAGNLFIGDYGNNRVRRLAPNGNITTVAGGGAATAPTGPATQARLFEPVAVAAGASGNLFIAERFNHRLRQVTPDGGISVIAGTGEGRVNTTMSGPALSFYTANPYAIATDGDAVLFTDDTSNTVGRLRGGQIEVVAGNLRSASTPATGDGGPATAAALTKPRGVASDRNGGFFLSEELGNRIRYVTPDGSMRIIAGRAAATAGFSSDEPAGPGGLLRTPYQLAFVAPCTLYAADTGNQRIRRLRPEIRYSIRPEPEGLVLAIDGELAAGPRSFSWEALTQHTVSAPSPQEVGEGTRYIAPAPQTLDLSCAPEENSLTVSFAAEHMLTTAADEGGSITPATNWVAAGREIKVEAVAKDGFVFQGWEGACSGAGPCSIVVDGPKSVRAKFGPP